MGTQKTGMVGRGGASSIGTGELRCRMTRLIAWGGVVLSLFAWTIDAVADYRVVAATGQDAPDTNTTFDLGVPGDEFSNPTIDSYGHVAFHAPLVDDYARDAIYWGFMPGEDADPHRLRKVKESTPADMSGGPFGVGGSPTIGYNGHTSFVTDDSAHTDAILAVYTPPATNSLATVASTANGFDDTEWVEPRINANGKVVFRDTRDGGSIWSNGFTNLSEIVKSGDTEPQPHSETFATFGVPVMNTRTSDGNGYAAFQATLNSGAGSGVWKQVPGQNGPELQKVARTGDSAPGIGGVTFDVFREEGRGQVGINNNSYTTFIADLTGSGVDDSNKTSIWKETSSGLTLVARNGTNLPGANFSDIDDGIRSTPVLNREGDVAFHAGGNQQNGGIWSEGIGHSLHKVAMIDEGAPGTGGAFFDGFEEIPSLNNGGRPIAINSVGQVAYFGRLKNPPEGGPIDSTNNVGIWVEDRPGHSMLVARKGDEILINSEPFTILELTVGLNLVMHSGGEDSRGTYFNDCGEVAYLARLSDDGTLSGELKDAIIVVGGIPLYGDANGDGTIDIFDINFISSHWNQTVTPGTNGDVNYDGHVDIFDINLISANWGKMYSPNCLSMDGGAGATAVPEPATFALAGAAAVLLVPLARRRRA